MRVSVLGVRHGSGRARVLIALLAMAGLASCTSTPERRVAPAKAPASAPRATAAAPVVRPVPVMRAASGVEASSSARSASHAAVRS